MPDLLLELLTEEIPARMQGPAAAELRRLVTDKLAAAGLGAEAVETFVTPRRLTLHVVGLPAAQADTSEERRGPRVGAPEAAVQGFLKSAGLTSLDQCEERDTGKGIFYFATIRRTGRPTAEVLPDLLRGAITELPWPKSMRFPAAPFRWVRPLTSVLSLFGGKVLPLDVGEVPVGSTTRGHRFLSDGLVEVRDFADYRAKLAKAFVVLDAAERRSAIAAALAERATAAGLTLKDDPALLDEVTGLVEWPVVLMGSIDPAFMELPPEVLTTSMRAHQKYFACLDRDGRLAPRFLVVANMAAEDGGKAIVAGNERVLKARLSDARFFWDQDRKLPLAARVPKLAERVFHAKLGSVLDKVGRMVELTGWLAIHIGASRSLKDAARATELAKADLSTGMVGEFPELQGVMGRYYALHDREAPAVADAIAEHYSPLGPNDRCPTAPTSVVAALADKVDTLVGFFSIGETPTGSKDPFALRRAALGVIRLIIENNLRLHLRLLFGESYRIGAEKGHGFVKDPTNELMVFFADRLKVHLREKGVRHDLIAAVFARNVPARGVVLHDWSGSLEDDLVRLLARVAALDEFLKTDDGANLLVAYRRATNIVRIEEKKDGVSYAGAPDPRRFAQPEEEILARRLADSAARSADALGREAFAEAMAALALLREPVDEFFTKVTVNCEDAELRANRLRLLSQIRDTLNRVADFSQIEG